MSRFFVLILTISCGTTHNNPEKRQRSLQGQQKAQNQQGTTPQKTKSAQDSNTASTNIKIEVPSVNEEGIPAPTISSSSDLLARYAPILTFHTEESYYPSSVEFFLEHTEEKDGFYTSIETLECPDCQNLDFLTGTHPNENPHIYSFIRERSPTTTDLYYFIFYPYNLGKEVCLGVDGLFMTGFDDIWDRISSVAEGCVGKTMRFGNHLGDWEHISIRLENGTPTDVHLSAHGAGENIQWSDLQKEGDHLIAYIANGSHGMYSSAKNHHYRSLPNGGHLTDATNQGLTWETWQNLVYVPYAEPGSYMDPFSWMNFTGRWGNLKEGCSVVESIAGECQLNSGPTGPSQKGVLDP